MSSVLIMLSTYNGENYLKKQLDTICKQNTECDIKLLVRDDGSTDSTVHILKQYENILEISFCNSGGFNLGAAKSFWILVKNAPNADYYAFVDQDDLWDDNKIERAILALQGRKAPTLWFSNCRIINECDEVIETRLRKKKPILDIPSQLVCGSAQGCSMVFNKAALELCRSKDLDIIPMHDLIFMIYVLAEGTVLYDDEPLFGYRVHSNNTVAKKGKNLLERIKTTQNSWFGKNSKYSISKFSKEVLTNSYYLDSETKKYLYELSRCKTCLKSRIFILNSKRTRTNTDHALFSFVMRVILGII